MMTSSTIINFDSKLYDYTKDYAIEASAGTGKTYNIVEIVKDLVVKRKIDLSKILIVTFTEKAAGELKNRIRSGIMGADNNIKVDIDKAPIFTIHSFCQNTLKELGISANQPLDLKLVGENEFKDFINRYVREGEILEEISKCYAANLKIDLDIVIDILKQSVNRYYLDSDYNEAPDIISLIVNEKEVREMLELMRTVSGLRTFDGFLAAKPEAKAFYEVLIGSSNESVRKLAERIKEKFDESFSLPSCKVAKKWKASQAETEAAEYFAKFKEQLDKLPRSSDKISPSKILPTLFIKDLYIKWQEYKKTNKAQDYGDMIRMIRESIINDDTLKNCLKQKYKYGIIDEFQDTNRSQFDIFSSIFMEDLPQTEEKDKHHIIVVGDPKQSIYAFQGADVDVYYYAIDAIVKRGGLKCTISRNYRSSKDMVESCNKLFSHYDFAGTEFNPCGYNDDTNNISKKNAKYCGKEVKAFWIAFDKSGEGYKPAEFASLAVEKIIDCCSIYEKDQTKLQVTDDGENYRNVTFKDFAILARTRTEMPEIVKALKAAGVPFVKYKDNGLFKGREVAHWIALFEAINSIDFTGSKRRLFKKVLFTAFFGLDISKINDERYNKDDNDENALVIKWKEIARERRWQDLIDDILINSRLVENTSSLGDLTDLSIYNQIGEYCVNYLSKGKTLDDLIIQLKNLSSDSTKDDDSDEGGGTVARGTNFDCVQIMTIHASKGLQFPVVISIAGFKRPYFGANVFTAHQTDNDGSVHKRIVFDHDLVRAEEEAEWKRLFYVAYTRPKHVLMLPMYKKYGMGFIGETLQKYIADVGLNNIYCIQHDDSYTLESLKDGVSSILSRIKGERNEITKEQFEKQKEKLKEIIRSEGKKSTYKHSYSSLSHDNNPTVLEVEDDKVIKQDEVLSEGLSKYDTLGKQIKTKVDASVKPIEVPNDFPKGAKIGTILHEVFEKTDFCNFENGLEELIKTCFNNEGLNPKDAWINYVKSMVDNVLNAELPIVNNKEVGTFKLSSISNNDKKAEAEFNFNLRNERLRNYCNGFIDLLFRRGEYYSVLDWKSDSLNDLFNSYSDNDELKKHIDEHYSIQRTLYSYCVIKWLQSIYKDLSEEEIFNKHFGGVYYVCIRGCNKGTGNGVYVHTWSSWQDLDKSFKEIVDERVGGHKNDL